MKIICPKCGWSKDLPDEKIPIGGGKGPCPKCKTAITINPPLNAKQTVDMYCPKCGKGQPQSDTCIDCGAVFKSLLKNHSCENKDVHNKLKIDRSLILEKINANLKIVFTVVIMLVLTAAVAIWKYSSNKRIIAANTISNIAKEVPVTHDTSEQKVIMMVDSYKAWKYEDGGFLPGILFKAKNLTSNKINGIDFRAVWIKEGNEQFSTASTYLSSLEPNLTSQDLKLVPNKIKMISGSQSSLQERIDFLNKDLTVKIYYKILSIGADEQLIYEGPFNAALGETAPLN